MTHRPPWLRRTAGDMSDVPAGDPGQSYGIVVLGVPAETGNSVVALGTGGRGAIIVKVTETGIRVALADDDILLREGLASLLDRSGFEVVGQCGTAAHLL